MAAASSRPARPRQSPARPRPPPRASTWPGSSRDDGGARSRLGSPMRRAKIVCTIGPATRSRAMLDRLVKAGMDVARINFSHGTQAEHGEVIRLIRNGEADWGRPITILQDLQGLKVRLGVFTGGHATLVTGEEFTLTSRPVRGTARHATISHPEYLRLLQPGDQVWMDDGMIQLTVESVADGEVRCRVASGGV